MNRKLIAKLIDLPNEEWHSLTMRMSWIYRTGGLMPPPPAIMALYSGELPAAEDWALLRRRINAARKADKMRESRYLKRQKLEHRRAYMRAYQKKRRAREQAQRAES